MKLQAVAIPLLLMVGGLVPCGSPSAAPAHVWKTYVNSRYGYSLCYPADLLRPGHELDAHDGVIFTGARGARLAVGASWTSDLQTTKSLVEPDPHEGVRVTYRAAAHDWAVSSGTTATDLYYARAQTTPRVQADYGFHYAKSDAGLYAPVIARMGKCFEIPQ